MQPRQWRCHQSPAQWQSHTPATPWPCRQGRDNASDESSVASGSAGSHDTVTSSNTHSPAPCMCRLLISRGACALVVPYRLYNVPPTRCLTPPTATKSKVRTAVGAHFIPFTAHHVQHPPLLLPHSLCLLQQPLRLHDGGGNGQRQALPPPRKRAGEVRHLLTQALPLQHLQGGSECGTDGFPLLL